MLTDQSARSERLPFEGTTARRLAVAFVLYGLVAVTFLGIDVPPFQNPDEITHFMRAAQVAEGGLIGNRFPFSQAGHPTFITSGGLGDPAMAWAFFPFDPVRFHPEIRATRSMWEPRIHWSGTQVPLVFPNSAIDPPLFYVPAAIGVLAGRISRMTVVQTLITSRLLTGAASVAIAAVAIACAGGASVWLFAIMTLPMSLSVISSVTQDALMLSCAALAAALLVRALRWPADRPRKVLAGLVATLILVGTARVPNGGLSVLPLGLTKLRWRTRLLSAAIAAGGVLAWAGLTSAVALVNFGDWQGADPTAQAARLLAHPLLIPPLAWNTLVHYWPDYLETFIGKLGWLDTPLPPVYHTAAQVMLGVAAVAATLGLRGERISAGSRLVIVAGVLLSAAGVFVAQYLTSTEVGHGIVDSVQGRHFLPLALPLAALLPALGNTRWARLHNPLVLVVAAFPLVSLAVVMRVVMLRYYLG